MRLTRNYRATERTKPKNISKRKASFDVASEHLSDFLHRALPPIRADIAKAAENTKGLMSEIPFINENLQNAPRGTIYGNGSFSPMVLKTTPSTFSPSGNNALPANGIESKALKQTNGPFAPYTNGKNGNGIVNTSVPNKSLYDMVDVATTVSSRTKLPNAGGRKESGRNKSGDANMNSSERSLLNDCDGEYPTVGKPTRTRSQQIIATPHEPCCECLGCAGMRGGMASGMSMGDVTSENTNRGAPICVLFAIFLLVSIVVISCVMVYLKAGRRSK